MYLQVNYKKIFPKIAYPFFSFSKQTCTKNRCFKMLCFNFAFFNDLNFFVFFKIILVIYLKIYYNYSILKFFNQKLLSINKILNFRILNCPGKEDSFKGQKRYERREDYVESY